jgi:hypothetical protein
MFYPDDLLIPGTVKGTLLTNRPKPTEYYRMNKVQIQAAIPLQKIPPKPGTRSRLQISIHTPHAGSDGGDGGHARPTIRPR